MMRKLFSKSLTAAVLSLAALAITGSTASAQSGQISFTGGVTLSNFAGDLSGNTLLIDFQNPIGGTTGTLQSAIGATGLFSGVVTNTPAVVSDLLATSTSATARSTPFLTFAGFTFSSPTFVNAIGGDLAFGPVKLVQDANSTSASLALSGILSGPGVTAGQRFDGIFTTQFAGQTPAAVFNAINTGGQISNQGVSASFSYNISTVPEPSTYALFAAGLLVVGLARRRRVRGSAV